MGSPKIILAIDDSPVNLKLIRVLLSAEGYQVITVPDAESAHAMIAHTRPDLILMDLQLPAMDGLSLTRQLKGNPMTKPIPIIAITAYAMKGDESRAQEAGCDAYVAKPIDTRTLPALIARCLQEASVPVPGS